MVSGGVDGWSSWRWRIGDGELGAKVGELGGKVGESGREGGVRAWVCVGEFEVLVSLSVSMTTSSSLSSGIWP